MKFPDRHEALAQALRAAAVNNAIYVLWRSTEAPTWNVYTYAEYTNSPTLKAQMRDVRFVLPTGQTITEIPGESPPESHQHV